MSHYSYYTILKKDDDDFQQDVYNDSLTDDLIEEGFIQNGFFASGKADYFNILSSSPLTLEIFDRIWEANPDDEVFTDLRGYREEMTFDEFALAVKNEFPDFDYNDYIISLIDYHI